MVKMTTHYRNPNSFSVSGAIGLFRLLAVCIFLLASGSSLAQIEIAPGFIVMKKGDTIRGFVENRTKNSDYKVCYFRAGKKEKSKVYTPNDLLAYGITSLKYFETITPKDENGNAVPIFATMVIGGRASLFETKKDLYLRHDSLGTWNITFKGLRDMLAMNKVRRLMNLAFSDCKKGMAVRWDSIVLNDKKMRELVNRYNACRGSNVKYNANAKIPGVKARLGLLAGTVMSSYKFATFAAGGANTLQATKFGNTTSPIVGLSLGLLFPRFSNNFEGYAEVSHFSSTNTGQATANGLSGPETEVVTLSASYFKTALGVKILFPTQAVTPYIKLGFSHFFDTDFVGTRTRTAPVGSTPVVSHPWVNATQNGVWGSVGIQRRIASHLALNLEARYENASGFNTAVIAVPLNSPEYRIKGSYLTFMFGLVF
jgi:hypothetical protein